MITRGTAGCGVNWRLMARGLARLHTRPQPVLPYKLGQPVHETRPHLVKSGDLTTGISALEYYERRLRLSQQMIKGSAAIVVSNNVQFASGSVFYDFQQDNNLFYLTGWLESNSVAVIEKVDDQGTEEDTVLHMLVPDKNEFSEKWEGERSGLQGCYDFFNADEVCDVKQAKSYLAKILKRCSVVYMDRKNGTGSSQFSNFFGGSPSNEHEDSLESLLKTHKNKVLGLTPIISQHREVKSPAEIAVMHKAGRISSRAINRAMAMVGSEQPLQSEKTLASYLEYQFVRGGCDKQAYIPVVASGENALVIHYTRNDGLLYDNELVFVDAGGKLGGYCADISRAWPNSPSGFTEPQKDIYEVVLSVNKACIDQCAADNQMSLNDLHEFSVTKLQQNLRSLPGFGNVSRSDVTKHLYPHYIGHHLGLDLHDVPSASKFKKLVAGNVITIEPGLYVPKDDRWPKHFHGIGVRVEDDVVVGRTSKETVNLTSLCAKEVKDIESLVQSGRCTTPGVYDELVDVSDVNS